MTNQFRGHTPFWFRARGHLGEDVVDRAVTAISVEVMAFVLCDIARDQRLGHAVIAPEARYVAIAWADREPLDRRHPGTADWHLLDAALKDAFPIATPLPSTHVITRMLLAEARRTNTSVQFVSAGPVTAKSSQVLVAVLDAWVRSLESR